MILRKWPSWLTLAATLAITRADEKYNLQNRDGSFQFGYDTPDSYHYADANRNNVVRGEFGGRNPGTGSIDKTIYTAGPRGYRPRGKNIARKYDLNQNGPRPIGSRDDPYFDPYEDPSYNFNFRTRTYNREENANRAGDVKGSYSYLDDVGERHNVEYIAGKNTGFHVKTPFPDSNPRAYGPLYFNGRGRPLPRGRTSIQRGLDGSYRFVSAGPDQRRTETSDATGHVRGSYTYLDDKGVQHSVHYIAGPETGYRVLKNVKGPHIPTVYPFGRPDILSPDFYEPFDSGVLDGNNQNRPLKPVDNTLGGGSDTDDGTSGTGFDDDGLFPRPRPTNRPGGLYGRPNRPTTPKPFTGSTYRPPNRPTFDDEDDGSDLDPFASGFGRPSSGSTPRPITTTQSNRGGSSSARPSDYDDGLYKPSGDDGSYKPTTADGQSFTGYGVTSSQRPSFEKEDKGGDFDDTQDAGGDFGLFGSESSRPVPVGGQKRPTSTGDKVFGDKTNQTPSRNNYGGGANKPPNEGGDSTYREDDDNDLFGTTTRRPTIIQGSSGDDFLGTKPSGGRKPVSNQSVGGDGFTSSGGTTGSGQNQDEFNFKPDIGGGSTDREGSTGYGDGRPTTTLGISGTEAGGDFFNEGGTIIRNLGDRQLSLPPGLSVRAHVQAIDLLPLGSRTPSPSEQFKAETELPREQLNEAPQSTTPSSGSVSKN